MTTLHITGNSKSIHVDLRAITSILTDANSIRITFITPIYTNTFRKSLGDNSLKNHTNLLSLVLPIDKYLMDLY